MRPCHGHALRVLHQYTHSRISTSGPRTPTPRHTSRFLLLYLSLTPLLMWERCGWATVPFTALVSFLLLGTENIGAQIEEPFTVLPMGAMCG